MGCRPTPFTVVFRELRPLQQPPQSRADQKRFKVRLRKPTPMKKSNGCRNPVAKQHARPGPEGWGVPSGPDALHELPKTSQAVAGYLPTPPGLEFSRDLALHKPWKNILSLAKQDFLEGHLSVFPVPLLKSKNGMKWVDVHCYPPGWLIYHRCMQCIRASYIHIYTPVNEHSHGRWTHLKIGISF